MEKVLITRNVAYYIEYCKAINLDFLESYTGAHNKARHFDGDLEGAIRYAREHQELYGMAWLIGYRILEPRYQVKVKAVTGSTKYLMYGEISDTWYFGQGESINMRSLHTKKELEDAGFGWVFSCSGIVTYEVYK